MVFAGQRIVEDHHDAVADKTFQRAFEFENQLAHLGVIVAEKVHDLLGFGVVGERREAAQVEKYDGDLTAMGFE